MPEGVRSGTPQGEWRVPRDNYGILTTHSDAAARAQAAQTRQRLDGTELVLGGRSLRELREQARAELVRGAQEFAAQGTCGCPGIDATAPVIATGHQPELFHPGVWAKNFAAHSLARCTGTPAWNLIVDNDLQGRNAILVPAGTRDEPLLSEIPFNTPAPPRPWEESSIAAPELLSSFGERMREAMARWNIEPFGADLWPSAIGAEPRSLVQTFVTLRRRAEESWSVRNVELPLSRLCSSEVFRHFAAEILVGADRFRACHNAALVAYRREHHIRSETHPVAALQGVGGAIEVPFWVWRAGESQRGRLSVRWHGTDRVEFLRGPESLGTEPVGPAGAAEAVTTLLSRLDREGWKVRTRALSTTLFARLVLSDLFIHGIGGAKYDQVTDELFRRFFGIEPPPFMVLTATLRLPLGELFPSQPRDAHRTRWIQNDQVWNPERYLPEPAQTEALARKRPLIDLQKTDAAARAELRDLRKTWRDEIEAEVAGSRRRAREIDRQLLANRRLTNRDFAWPLHPRASLDRLWETLAAALRSG